MTTLEYVNEMAKVLDRHKATRISALDVTELTVMCSYMVIASGRNVIQVRAMSDDIEDRLNELGYSPRRVEGRSDGRWIIMDYGDILVELFNREEREYYNLDRLWNVGTNQVELDLQPED